ncbi:eCIS core domain-containing protein [Kitasatospora sp. NPDC001660]
MVTTQRYRRLRDRATAPSRCGSCERRAECPRREDNRNQCRVDREEPMDYSSHVHARVERTSGIAVPAAALTQRGRSADAAEHAEAQTAPVGRFGADFSLVPARAQARVGSVDDPLEHEAARLATRLAVSAAPVAPGPDPGASAGPGTLRRFSEAGDGRSEDALLLRKAEQGRGGGPVPVTATQVLGQGGTPLAAPERAYFGPRLGTDLSQVRVHSGPSAERAAEAVDARAFTLGEHVVLGSSHATGTAGRRELLAHELVHVAQYRKGLAEGGTAPVLRRKPKTGHKAPESTVPKECRDSAKACFSISRRRAWLLKPGRQVVSSVPALGGREGHPTPVGKFKVHFHDKHHVSSLYHAKMPYYVNFTDKVGFHAGSLSTRSHGCVHLSMEAAEQFFNYLKDGDLVDVVP